MQGINSRNTIKLHVISVTELCSVILGRLWWPVQMWKFLERSLAYFMFKLTDKGAVYVADAAWVG